MNYDEILESCKNLFEVAKGPFTGAILAAIAFFLYKNLIKTPFDTLSNSLYLFRNRKYILPKALANYRTSLVETTLKINHAWKLEGQSFKELLVPINVEKKGKTARLPLKQYIITNYTEKPNSRFVILGAAGSGKSVAMGDIARNIWNVEKNDPIVPVLLTFSIVKEVKSKEVFEKIIIETLEQYQFEEGKNNDYAENFVDEHLYAGNILLLLDGFDELEKNNRIQIANFLNKFFQTYPQIPFVISSRIAVWRQIANPFPALDYEVFEMANFTPLEIQSFVNQWDFSGNKSGEQLAEIIQNKIYLKQIAVNPLLLTIITFLYAQPKRILPDNRVKFYKECVEALLEKWDFSKSLARVNEFETIDKITILNQIAYQHIINEQTTDEEISKKAVLDTIAEVMRKLSRPVAKQERMLLEIVENADLLVALPPDGYKFPHRTFMEYFAANYFFEENKHKELFDLYQKDNGKWEETLSLFCGLNTNAKITNEILLQLKQNLINTQNETEPNGFVFKCLVESARINPQIAQEILVLGATVLEGNLQKDIIENLGYISINPNWAHAEDAQEILLKLLDKDIDNEGFQQILIALGHIKNEKIQNIILSQSEKIDLTEFLAKVGQNSEEYARKLLETIPSSRYGEILGGLKDAGNLDFLFALMIKGKKEELCQHAAWQLCLSSKSNGFFDWLDTKSLEELDTERKDKALSMLREWTWTKEYPRSDEAKCTIFLICGLVEDLLVAKKGIIEVESYSNVHYWFWFLIGNLSLRLRESQLLENTLGVRKLELSINGSKYLWKKKRQFFLESSKFLILIIFFLYPFFNLIIIPFLSMSIFHHVIWWGNLVLLSLVIVIIVGENFMKKHIRIIEFLNKFMNNNYFLGILLTISGSPLLIYFLISDEYLNSEYEFRSSILNFFLSIYLMLVITVLLSVLEFPFLIYYTIIFFLGALATQSLYSQNNITSRLFPSDKILEELLDSNNTSDK